MKRLYASMMILIAFSIISLPLSHAASLWPVGCQEGSLPSNDPKYPSNQLILTCMPQNWNGQLVVYAHGYTPIQEPLSLPVDELTLSDGQTFPAVAMSFGFAFATSSYHKNGYAVEQAEKDLNDLVNYFKNNITAGPVQKVYIIGASEGGLIAAMLLERHPNLYHGGISLCGPVGGMPY